MSVAQEKYEPLVAKTREVCCKFEKVLTLFGKCHNVYNGGTLTGNQIDELGKAIIFPINFTVISV